MPKKQSQERLAAKNGLKKLKKPGRPTKPRGEGIIKPPFGVFLVPEEFNVESFDYNTMVHKPQDRIELPTDPAGSFPGCKYKNGTAQLNIHEVARIIFYNL